MSAPSGWLQRLARATTRDETQVIARQALADGASPADVAAALIEWDLLQDAAELQVGGGS